jgi:ABC-2 type transport system permease protein
MTWQAVARKDFRDSVRSYWLWALSAAFVAFFAASVYFFANPLGKQAAEQNVELTSDAFIQALLITTRLFIPVIAIVIAYASITGERDSGTLKLLLALPHSRRDVVVGKLFGRGGVVVLPVVLGLAAGAVAFMLTKVDLAPVTYLQFAGLTALLGLVFVAVAVGISAGTSSNRRSMISSVGIFVLFSLFWAQFSRNLSLLTKEYLNTTRNEMLLMEVFLKLLNPIGAYRSLAYRITISGPMEARAILIGQSRSRIRDFQYLLRNTFRTEVPWFLEDWVVVLIIVFWIVVPPVLGYLVFREVDL